MSNNNQEIINNLKESNDKNSPLLSKFDGVAMVKSKDIVSYQNNNFSE